MSETRSVLRQMEAQVMLLRNLDMQQPSSMLVNGSRGVIIAFRKKEARSIATLPSGSLPRMHQSAKCRQAATNGLAFLHYAV